MTVGSLGGQLGWAAIELFYPKEMDRTAPLDHLGKAPRLSRTTPGANAPGFAGVTPPW